jgi:hypothetical protein
VRRTDVTYGQLDRALRSLGFTCRPGTNDPPGRIYEHKKTGALIPLPAFPESDKVYEHHLVAARLELVDFGIADAATFDAKLQKAGWHTQGRTEKREAAVMNSLRRFKQELATISRMWGEKTYDTALAEVESMLKVWPGNAHLHILWASLVQLQEDPQHGLEEAKQALQQAVELDKASPTGAIELGHFLDNVEDDPRSAFKAYAEGVAAARQLLIEGLTGQAKALRQLDMTQEFHRCLREVIFLTQFETGAKRNKVDETGADVMFESPTGHFYAVQLKGPYAELIQELLNEVVAHDSAQRGAAPDCGGS